MDQIKYVLLDMDGTLLDKYFDDYFWEQLVPEKYAAKYSMTFGRAKEHLTVKYKFHEGTLKWTDLDFWSRELNLDIPALKEQIQHLIEVHPHAEDFLRSLRSRRKKVFLVTNAHYKSINLKMKKTRIGRYFDTVLSSFDIGYPKETLDFWREAEKRLHFDKRSTLFIDDTEDVLKTAHRYGIGHILFKATASSKTEPSASARFQPIYDFQELI
jgi:putative hydrolase of the HAD superfamily